MQYTAEIKSILDNAFNVEITLSINNVCWTNESGHSQALMIYH